MDFVALFWKGRYAGEDGAFGAEQDQLVREGWQECARASWHRQPPKGGACIMRRLREPHRVVAPTDEPRKWTEKEIEEIAKRYYWRRAEEELVGSLAQRETAMQAFCYNELLKRNSELQAAIDRVVAVRKKRGRGVAGDPKQEAVQSVLYPLATKEEANG